MLNVNAPNYENDLIDEINISLRSTLLHNVLKTNLYYCFEKASSSGENIHSVPLKGFCIRLVWAISCWRVSLWSCVSIEKKLKGKCLPQRALLRRLVHQFRAQAIFHRAQMKQSCFFLNPWLECASKWLKMKMAGFTLGTLPYFLSTDRMKCACATRIALFLLHSSRLWRGQEH